MTRAVLIAALLAGGCVPVAADVDRQAPAAQAGACNANEAGPLIGKANSPALIEEAKRLTGAKAIRAIGPDDAVTMDYRQDRLNLRLDAQGRVIGVDCG